MSRDFLAVAGILFILIVVSAAIYIVFYLMNRTKSRSNMRMRVAVPAPEPEEALPPPPFRAAVINPVPEPEAVPSPPPKPPVEVKDMSSFRACYDSLHEIHKIPWNAMTVKCVANIFLPGGEFEQYCWIHDGSLKLFPVFDSLVRELEEQLMPENDALIRLLSIPLSDIVCFVRETGIPDPFVALQYRKNGTVRTLSFTVEAADVFAEIIPEREYTHLLKTQYPKSSRNINDIKESFLVIKQLRQDDLITEEEYAEKKKEIVIFM